jgi:hypothetical protein
VAFCESSSEPERASPLSTTQHNTHCNCAVSDCGLEKLAAIS